MSQEFIIFIYLLVVQLGLWGLSSLSLAVKMQSPNLQTVREFPWIMGLGRHFFKEDMYMVSKHM